MIIWVRAIGVIAAVTLLGLIAAKYLFGMPKLNDFQAIAWPILALSLSIHGFWKMQQRNN